MRYDGATSFGMNPPRILMIEDDDFVRVVLGRMLAQFGCVAIGARTGAEARSFAAQGAWDVVFVDAGLPDADGLVLLRELDGMLPETSFIVLSGRNISRHEVPADCVIRQKPLVVRELFEATRVAVHAARARRGAD